MKVLSLISPTVALATLVPFFEGKAGWKLTEDGSAIQLKDGNPVWVDADGSERTLGADTITTLNREAKSHREAKEAAESKLKTFEGIDPAKAREALELTGKLDKKALIDAGEVDRVKESMKTEFQGLIDEANKKAADAEAKVNNLTLETAFKGSKFITDKLAIPADLVQAAFGKNFEVQDGKIVAKGADGNPVMSKAKIGEPADFEEALGIIVENYPQRDLILKGGNHAGSGNGGGGGGGKPGQQRYSRDEFGKLPPAKQAEISGMVREGKAELVD